MTGRRPSGALGLPAVWAMAVGGMVGGGIFTVLGVVIARSGAFAWVAFLIGGVFAFITADSYARLAQHYDEGGGAFTYLRHANRSELAGSLAWLLIAGYVLTIAVYAFTFSHYLGRELGFGGLMTRLLAVSAIAIFVATNVRGAASSARLEIALVAGKVVLLLLLGLAGLARGEISGLSSGADRVHLSGIVLGAATVFMAYEGFQLLAYDYEEIQDPRTTLGRGTMLAVLSVVGLYILVTIGAAMLAGAGTLVEQQETALAVAGEDLAGGFGRGAVVVGAVLSAGSAINATLFATARLARAVSAAGELPPFVAMLNKKSVPQHSLLLLGSAAALLAVIGSLGELVEAASLTFLITFALVNGLAFRGLSRRRWLAATGAVGMTLGAVVLAIEMLRNAPEALALLVAVGAIALFARPYLRDRMSWMAT